MKSEKVYNNPTPWVSKHVQEYLETGGKKGHKWNGVRALLLTTRGRDSGKLRRTALIYGEDKGNYIVVASRGGHPEHPNWFLNLSADPKVRVQVAEHEFEGHRQRGHRRPAPAPLGAHGRDLARVRELPEAHPAHHPGRGPQASRKIGAQCPRD